MQIALTFTVKEDEQTYVPSCDSQPVPAWKIEECLLYMRILKDQQIFAVKL